MSDWFIAPFPPSSLRGYHWMDNIYWWLYLNLNFVSIGDAVGHEHWLLPWYWCVLWCIYGWYGHKIPNKEANCLFCLASAKQNLLEAWFPWSSSCGFINFTGMVLVLTWRRPSAVFTLRGINRVYNEERLISNPYSLTNLVNFSKVSQYVSNSLLRFGSE